MDEGPMKRKSRDRVQLSDKQLMQRELESAKLPLDRSTPLAGLLASVPVSYLQPRSFFVSWHGVIVLVFDGWPRPVKRMKQEMEKLYHSSMGGISAENFGSKFPKMTLAALKDGHTMTKGELEKLRQLCDDHPCHTRGSFCMDELSLITYANRSQELIFAEKSFRLCARHEYRGSPAPLELDMMEEDDEPYLRHGHRISYYRKNDIGVSLVYRPKRLPKWLLDFVKKLPTEMYTVFDPRSFHVTVRGIRH